MKQLSRNRSACRFRAKTPGMPLKSPSGITPVRPRWLGVFGVTLAGTRLRYAAGAVAGEGVLVVAANQRCTSRPFSFVAQMALSFSNKCYGILRIEKVFD